ncbi:MAG: hypothetical protein K8R76_04975 [Candidatus Aegiribacteria sp.]|nr:hypothetical protein [Candidatus Aegiribacteria sp.]
MRSKILVRILIVLLAVFLVFRIHQRVETYRIPREFCRSQMSVLSIANIHHMYVSEGIPAPDLDSLLSFAEANNFFDASINNDSILVSFNNDRIRKVQIPQQWKDLWNENAILDMENFLDSLNTAQINLELVISEYEGSLGFSLDSLITLRDIYIIDNTLAFEEEGELSPGEFFNDSIGFDPELLIMTGSDLASSISSMESMILNFNNIIAPARMDSVAALVIAVCPSLWESGFYDSIYSYDPKLALGTQFSLSCPNIDRHGGVVGGLIEKDFPDSLFLEEDWSETLTVFSFPEYAEMRRLQVSRANLIRAAEEQAAYLAQRYPSVIHPKLPENLDVDIDNLIDPLGGEYVFEVIPDTTYIFYENPRGTSRRARGDSVLVETMKFVAYTTMDPELSRVEVFFTHPLRFPSRSDGAIPGTNDKLTVIMNWDRSELGTLQIDEREVDLVEESSWDFISSKFGTAEGPDSVQ